MKRRGQCNMYNIIIKKLNKNDHISDSTLYLWGGPILIQLLFIYGYSYIGLLINQLFINNKIMYLT